MCTEAARRSQEAIDSARGPGRRTWDRRAVDPHTGEPLPARPLVALRRRHLLMIASVAPATVLTLGWLVQGPAPTGSALLWGGGLGVYCALLTLQGCGSGLAGLDRAHPRAWPRQTGFHQPRAPELVAYAAGAAVLCLVVALFLSRDDGAGADGRHWALLGALSGATVGSVVALLTTIRAERRSGVRLYRERPSMPSPARPHPTDRRTYAGPPPDGTPGYSSSSSQSPARNQ